ncbi:flagellar hook-length control protein FliK [Antarctobacter heliothermus]|uniref:Hook-length control protein FliK n=1 Tax=Antarctobacter heliothermus TaxID=74033 RepID=A0A239BVE0_9RHOB|nr:flagellar hook-length control protein FliK [Antarctobacter heliothermus]SNS11388.1 hook-length control protein FliK [Antarctobacter heliothermus]
MLSQLTSLLGLTPASRSPNTQTGEEATIDFASVFADVGDEQPSWRLDPGPIAETDEGEEPDGVLLPETDGALPDEVDVDPPVTQRAETDDGEIPLASGLNGADDLGWTDEDGTVQHRHASGQEQRDHDGFVATTVALVSRKKAENAPVSDASLTVALKRVPAVPPAIGGNRVPATNRDGDTPTDTTVLPHAAPVPALGDRGAIATVEPKDHSQQIMATSGSKGAAPLEDQDLVAASLTKSRAKSRSTSAVLAGLESNGRVDPVAKGAVLTDELSTHLVEVQASGAGRYSRMGTDLAKQVEPSDAALISKATTEIGKDVRPIAGQALRDAGQRELPVFQLGLSAADQFPRQFSRNVAPKAAAQKVSAPPQDWSTPATGKGPGPDSTWRTKLSAPTVSVSGVTNQQTPTDVPVALGASRPLGATPETAEIIASADTVKPLTVGSVPAADRKGELQLLPAGQSLDHGRPAPEVTSVRDSRPAVPHDQLERDVERADTSIRVTGVAPTSDSKGPSVPELNRTTIGLANIPRSKEIADPPMPSAPYANREKPVMESFGKSGPMFTPDPVEMEKTPIAAHQHLTRRSEDRHFRSDKSTAADGVVVDRASGTTSTDRTAYYSGPVAVVGKSEASPGVARVTSPMLADVSEDSLSVEVPRTGAVADVRPSGAQVMPAASYTHRADATATVRQVAEGMARLSEGSVEIRLSPEELGQVRMQLLPSDTGMTVHVSADRPETLDLLRRHIDQLARDLADAGYDGASFTFSEGDRGQRDGHPPTDRDGAIVATEDQHTTRAPVAAGATDGLDLRF